LQIGAGGTAGSIGAAEEIAPTLGAAAGNQRAPGLADQYGVRRLMPVECERLQGFPDGYTDVPYKGKPMKDGPRYRMLGNSIATECLRFLGERIKVALHA